MFNANKPAQRITGPQNVSLRVVEPDLPRARINHNGFCTTITIPNRLPFYRSYITAVLVWAMASITLEATVLTILSLPLLAAIYLYQNVGKEVIILGPTGIDVQRHFGIYKSSRHFDKQFISSPGIADPGRLNDLHSDFLSRVVFSKSALKFDYQNEQIAFGFVLDITEHEYLLDIMQKYLSR